MTAKRFTLHESTQRGLSRLAFLSFGAAPLLLCLYMCVVNLIPGNQRRQAIKWQQELSTRFGTPVLVETAHATAPLSYQLQGVKLLLPDGKSVACTIASMNIHWDARGCWNIKLEEPSLHLERFGNLCRSFSNSSMTSHGLRSLSNWLIVEADSVQLEDETVSIKGFRLNAMPLSEKVLLSSAFKISMNGNQAGQLQEIKVISDFSRSAEDDRPKFQLSAPSPIPCSALAKIFQFPISIAAMQSLQQSRFTGQLDIRDSIEGANYYLRECSFQNVDVSQFTGGVEAALSGVGTLKIKQAQFKSMQVGWLQGSLDIGAGKIDAAVLSSLARNLKIDLYRPISGSVGFDRLVTSFTLLPETMAIQGQNFELGCFLQDAQGVLAAKSDSTKFPLLSLIHALVPQPDQPLVTSRTAGLVRTALIWLPFEESQRKQAELVLHR